MKNRFIFFLFSVFCLLFSIFIMFHTFSYDSISNTMDIAGKCWSDFGSHIPLIRSFSLGGNFDRIMHFHLPEYPIFPGEPIRYHFIFYLIVGLLEKIGFRIDWALNIPSILGFSSLLILIFYLSSALFHDQERHCERSEAISIINLPAGRQGSPPRQSGVRDDNTHLPWALPFFSILFFLFNGSLSFLKFFEKHPFSPSTLRDIISNTTFPSFGPWDNGLVSAFWNLNIYTNQRHLAAGFALGLGFIALLLFLEKKPWKHQLSYLLVSVPALIILPYVHQPMLLICALFMAWYVVVFPRLRIFLFLTGVLSLGPILLQVYALSGNTSSFAWYPGYLIHGDLTLRSFLTYWFYNLGLHMILIPIGFLLSPIKVKKVVFPIFLLFLIANLFKFSVEIAANHKFFNFFMIFGNMLSAYALFHPWSLIHSLRRRRAKRLKKSFHDSTNYGDDTARGTSEKFLQDVSELRIQENFSARISARIILFILIFFLIFSGIIDLFPVINDQKIPVIDLPRNETAQWIAQNTPRDAVFLNSSYLYNPASLAGRFIFLGWPYFPWSAGYTENRMAIMDTLYESKDPSIFCPLLAKYTISYVEVKNVTDDPDLPNIDPTYFHSLRDPVFSAYNDAYLLFTTESLCSGL